MSFLLFSFNKLKIKIMKTIQMMIIGVVLIIGIGCGPGSYYVTTRPSAPYYERPISPGARLSVDRWRVVLEWRCLHLQKWLLGCAATQPYLDHRRMEAKGK